MQAQTGTIYSEGNRDIPEKIRLAPGDTLALRSSRYSVEEEAGKGGFAHVYKVRNVHNDVFALKLMDLWMMKPDEYEFLESKFRQEFETGRIRNDNLVQSHYGGHIMGNPYILMDFCPNGTLASRMQEFTEESRYSDLATALLSGLRALHAHGIIHRDIKPENVLFSEDNMPKLTDFGIAGHLNKRLTSRNFIGMVSEVWGSPLYAPPEQLDHGKAYKLTAPSMDIFSFGVLMHEVISSGRHPFGIHQELLDTPQLFVERVKSKNYSPLPLQTGKTWRNIIEKCLEPHPQDRFQDVEQILALLSGPSQSSARFYSRSLTETGSALLKVIEGEEVSHVYSLDALYNTGENTELTIGWKDDTGQIINAIPITETRTNYISRRHATISRTNGAWSIRDGQKTGENESYQYSLNGTYLNYRALENNQTEELKSGDIITVGDTVLKFLIV